MNKILEVSKKFKEIDKKYFDEYGGKGYSKTYRDYTSDPNYMLNTLLEYHIAPDTLLDAGCASGELVRDLRKLGIKAYGIDNNEHILKKSVAPKYCTKMDLREIGKLKSDLFDIVFTNALMYVFPQELQSILKGFHKVVKKGVWLCNPYLGDLPFEDAYRKFLGSEKWWADQFCKAGFEKLTKNLFKKTSNLSA